jgi:hypothetical protein
MTAVDFLQYALSIHFTFEQKMQFEGLFQQAKEMEKQQTCDFADWIRVCKMKGRPYDFENTKELLKIYKEEKGL